VRNSAVHNPHRSSAPSLELKSAAVMRQGVRLVCERIRTLWLGRFLLQFSFDALDQLQNFPIFEAHIRGLAGIHGPAVCHMSTFLTR
jgi:hypothetical protein